jgi:hypothetical protein
MAAKRLKGIYKYSDSKNWWFRYTDPITGKRKAVSLGTDDGVAANFQSKLSAFLVY